MRERDKDQLQQWGALELCLRVLGSLSGWRSNEVARMQCDAPQQQEIGAEYEQQLKWLTKTKTKTWSHGPSRGLHQPAGPNAVARVSTPYLFTSQTLSNWLLPLLQGCILGGVGGQSMVHNPWVAQCFLWRHPQLRIPLQTSTQE